MATVFSDNQISGMLRMMETGSPLRLNGLLTGFLDWNPYPNDHRGTTEICS